MHVRVGSLSAPPPSPCRASDVMHMTNQSMRQLPKSLLRLSPWSLGAFAHIALSHYGAPQLPTLINILASVPAYG